jgi:hypothetical protein
MTPSTHDTLQQRLVAFGSSLTEVQCKELRDILDALAKLAYDVAEVYKMAVIDLIPSKVAAPVPNFAPVTKTADTKGNPLAELLHNLSEADKAKLVSGLKTKLGETE